MSSNTLLAQFIPAEVSEVDKNKYKRIMANWTYLSTFMCATSPDEEVIGTLLYLELNGKNRKDILERLVSRLTSCVRQRLKQELAELYERSPR